MFIFQHKNKAGSIIASNYMNIFLYSKINTEFNPHQKSLMHSVEKTGIKTKNDSC